MQFYEPHYLKFIFFLPLLLVLGWFSARLRRRRLQKLGYEPVVTAKLMPGYRKAEAGIRIFLLMIVFAFLLLALARPQWGESSKKVERKGVDIIFLLDTSLSMLSEDVKPNRFLAAGHTIKSIVRKLKGDRVGLVVFSGSSYLQTPLTLDYSAFMLFLESVKVGHVPDPGSSLSSAFDYVLRIFPKEDLKYKVLILLTEGEDTLGGLDESLKALKEAKIRVYPIGMGTEAGGPIPLKDQTGRQIGFKKDRAGAVVISRMDPVSLKKIADETEGVFLPSSASEREVDLLLKHIGSLGQKNINEKMIAEKEDHYGFFLFWAFIFLLLEMFVRRSQKIKPAIMMFAAFILFSGFIETPRGLNKQGNEEFAQKKYQSALADYQKAKVKAPEDPAIRYNLGTALYQTNQYKDARQEFQKAVQLSKQDPELQAKSYYNLGNTEYRLGNFEGAIKNYKEALKLNPKDADAKSNLEFVQKQKSMFDKKNDQRKKDNPQQDQKQDQQQQQDQNQQNQQQNQQSQQQDQQNQNQQQNQQQNQDQQNQNQQNQNQQNQQQNQQNQSEQKQEQGGQGGGSGEQDPNSQPQDSQGQQQNQDKQDQQDPSSGQGQQDKPDQQQNQNEPSKSEPQKEQQEKPGQQGEQSQQDQPKPEQGQNEPKDQQPQEQKEQSGQKGEQSDQQEQQQEQPKPQQGQEESQEQPKPEPSDTGESQEPEPSQDQGQEPQPAEPSQESGDEPQQEPSPEEQNDEQQPGAEAQDPNQELEQPSEAEQSGQEPGEESGEEGQDSQGQGQEKGNAGGGAGTQYQGQMSLDNALKILDALHEGEKEFSDLRRPPTRRQQASVEKDW